MGEARQLRGERVLFVSDVHLTPAQPDTFVQFMRFLREEAAGARALYVLGDLFDFWVGRRQASLPGFEEVFRSFRELTGRGTEVHFLSGNRDFALDAEFAAGHGLRMLPDVAEVRLGSRRVLVTHGDLLCTRDERYQRMRHVIRSRFVRGIFTRLPLRISLRLAAGARLASGAEIERKSRYVLDPDFEEVRDWLEKGYDALIFGHVHTGEHYRIPLDDREAEVFVLGSWEDRPNFVEWDGEGLALRRW